MDLTNKVAIVTGGSRGIGLGIARALLDHGAAVAITGTSEQNLARAADLLGARGRLLALQADVRQPDEVQRAFSRVANEFRGLDLLVNNAGVGQFTNVAEMTVEQWHLVLDTNLSGVFYCCRAAIPYLRERGGGWIINISSLAGKNAFPGAAAYCASKSGLNAFSEALMQEVRYDGIRVSYVMPGSVATEFGGPTGAEGEWKLTAQDVAEVVMALIAHPARSLPSRVEIRPAQPPKKG
jgi:3-oxoacyl-[acyl-carrier protein] reductase